MKDTKHTMENMADTLKKLYGDELRFTPTKKSAPKPVSLSQKARLFFFLGILSFISLASAIFTFNQIVTLKEAVYSNQGRVHAEMQRRNNLFSNLVELYLSYTELEKDIFSHVAEVRGQVEETQKLLDKVKATPINNSQIPMAKSLNGSVGNIDTTLSRLMAVVEQYPDLKAFEPHKNLVHNIVLSEDRIITERGNLNTAVRIYNNLIAQFPYRYLAWVFGFDRMDYFEPSQATKTPPKLTWGEFKSLRDNKDSESVTKH
jgi:LemA protein